MRTVVAVDVGGTSMKGAVVAAGRVLSAERRPTGRERGPAAVVADVVDFVAGLCARHGASAAGLVVPGIVDEDAGVAVHSSNIGWRDVPLRDLVAGRTGLPVALGHDVRAGGLAEGELGAGRDAADFAFVPVGTGVAAALVLSGAPYRGASGWGGELGHLTVVPGGEPCACGRRGCLEAYGSCAAIIRRYGEPGLTAEDVIARAAADDGHAARVWDEALDALAAALDSCVMLLDPELLILGGGLADSGETVLAPLRTRLAARLAFRGPPPLVAAALGSRAATLGAALLATRL